MVVVVESLRVWRSKGMEIRGESVCNESQESHHDAFCVARFGPNGWHRLIHVRLIDRLDRASISRKRDTTHRIEDTQVNIYRDVTITMQTMRMMILHTWGTWRRWYAVLCSTRNARRMYCIPNVPPMRRYMYVLLIPTIVCITLFIRLCHCTPHIYWINAAYAHLLSAFT